MHPALLRLEQIDRGRHQVAFTFSVDDLTFQTSYWYGDLDLLTLEETFGAALLEKIYLHQALFEANKLCSLRPEALDLGAWAHHHTQALEEVWRTIFTKVWAQWRYENDDPHYTGPVWRSSPAPVTAPGRVTPGPVSLLSFCGGGKDSLVSGRLLEKIDVPYASYAYAHSIYGQAAPQHRLIDGLLDGMQPVRRHRQWVNDTFTDAPVLDLHPELGIKTWTAAETPSSIFAVLPVMLAHGYRFIALGHEASANFPNLTWSVTGEAVNHQWGKSLASESLLNGYVQTHLLENVACFGVLQPIHDPTIFHLLNRDLDAVPLTHSCNVAKPWCRRCPKCAYVWLGYAAYLPEGLVDEMFPENLFNLPENQLAFRQMLGLEAHTPFECIGRIPEVRLAFELCRRRGRRGRAMSVYAAEAPFDPATLPDCVRWSEGHNFPTDLAPPLLDELRSANRAATDYVRAALNPSAA